MSKILVVGASGTVGSELSRVLAAQGHRLRKATSRAPTAAEQVQLGVVARRGLDEALSGADAPSCWRCRGTPTRTSCWCH